MKIAKAMSGSATRSQSASLARSYGSASCDRCLSPFVLDAFGADWSGTATGDGLSVVSDHTRAIMMPAKIRRWIAEHAHRITAAARLLLPQQPASHTKDVRRPA